MTKGYVYETVFHHWQTCNWLELSRYTLDDLAPWDSRAELALMVAVAHLQCAQIQEATIFIQRAGSWGSDTQMQARYLLMGVHVALHRAGLASVEGISEKASQKRLQILARGVTAHAPELSGRISLTRRAQSTVPKAGPRAAQGKRLKTVCLGQGWAGNTVNTVIFRHHGIFTADNNQYTAFYVDEQTLRIVKRNLKNNYLTTHDLKGEYNLEDAHNSISLGMDRAGIAHISYDHHGTRLRYRRSLRPHDITAWTEELSMTGVNEKEITYPTFIEPKSYNPLLLLYRDGNWRNGTAYLKAFDEEQQAWHDYPKPILSGADNRPWTSNAYWNHPAVDDDGRICLSYVWRTDYQSSEKRINNLNLGFAQSFDQGNSWYTSHCEPYRLPITQVNTETVLPVSPGSNLINQCSMALDSMGHPHIVFYANDETGIPQYQHCWFDGYAWNTNIVTGRTKGFSLLGGGTLRLPISRPEVVIDRNDSVYIIYRDEIAGGRLVATMLSAPDYARKSTSIVLCDGDLGYAEPIIDRTRWLSEGVLSILVQRNEQPDHDRLEAGRSEPVSIMDFCLG